MRASEFLKESITFDVGVLKDYGKQKAWSGEDFGKFEMNPCWVCDGKGHEEHNSQEHGHYTYECGMCKGTGKTKEWVSNAPSINVSNSNGYEIMSMLGLAQDSSGVIENKDLPKVMKRLMMLKNKGSAQHTADQEVSGGVTRAYKDDNGMSRIGKSATMYDMGRTQSQVDRYIDTLMSMIKFAQQHNAGITWG